jgi:hypothetical protein
MVEQCAMVEEGAIVEERDRQGRGRLLQLGARMSHRHYEYENDLCGCAALAACRREGKTKDLSIRRPYA